MLWTEDPAVAKQAKDILLKRIAAVLGDALAERFALNLAPIVAHLPSDLPVLEVRAQYADLLFLLADDTILLLELQSKYSYEDLLRLADYCWTAFRQYGKRVFLVILYGPRVGKPPTLIDAGSHQVGVTNIQLREHEAEAALARLQAKVARGEDLDAVDRIDLVLAPLMRQERPLGALVHDLLPIVEALPVREQAETVGTIIGLSYHYLEESEAKALLEGLKMANALEEMIAAGIKQGRTEGIEQGRTEGIEQGQLDGKRAALRTLLRVRLGTVPPALEARITAANDETLDALLVRAANLADLSAL